MKTKIYLAALVFGVSLASCKKEGCTDNKAENYDSKAKKDCNCCTYKAPAVYEGRAVFWFKSYTAVYLAGDGVSSMSYYMNGEKFGSSASNLNRETPPKCGQDSSVTVTRSLGESISKDFEFQVKDDRTGHVYWDGTLNMTANSCQSKELKWEERHP